MRRQLSFVGFASAAFLGWSCRSAGAATITLKSSVRLEARDQIIALGDIAELEGPEAIVFAELPIATCLGRADQEITLAQVRAKLDEAGAHWGHINLSGRSVAIRAMSGSAAVQSGVVPIAMAPLELDSQGVEQAAQEPTADQLIDLPTWRGQIARLFVENLRVKPGDLRLTFDTVDSEALDASPATFRFEIHPLGSCRSDRVAMAVRQWNDEQVERNRVITVKPRVRVGAAVLRRPVVKDQTIVEADVQTVDQWLPPSQVAMAIDQTKAIGRVVAKALKADEVLQEKHLRRQTLIKRGDLVTVRCLVGGVAISLAAEARADGAEGETIEFRKQGERATFLATVSSRGEAVLKLNRK